MNKLIDEEVADFVWNQQRIETALASQREYVAELKRVKMTCFACGFATALIAVAGLLVWEAWG